MAPPAPVVAIPAANAVVDMAAAATVVAAPRAAVDVATKVTEMTLLTPRMAEELTLERRVRE